MTIGEGSIIIRNLIEFQRIHYIWLHLNREKNDKKANSTCQDAAF
jgi:hypothetical protein